MRLVDESGDFMPHWKSRRTTGSMAAINAEVVHAVDGDESVVIFLSGTGTLNATYIVEGSPDGVEYFPLLSYPYTPASLGNALPQAGQPLFAETVNAATVKRMLCAAVGGLRKIRVRLSAYASGTCAVNINSDTCASINPFVRTKNRQL